MNFDAGRRPAQRIWQDAPGKELVIFRVCGRMPGSTPYSFRPDPIMGNKIVTEADRKATPRPALPIGTTATTGKGQKRSLERGAHTRSKKNPGKRARQG